MPNEGYCLRYGRAKEPGAVIFDVEGVIVPKKRFLYFALGRHLPIPQFLRIVFYGFLYEIGLMSLKNALSHVFKVFHGMEAKDLRDIFKQVPLMPYAKEVFKDLRSAGWRTALISSGLPTIVVRDLASTLKADYAFGIELETQNDIFTGEISGEVIERKGKLLILRKILTAEKLRPKDCVVVGDDRNNLPIFLPETLKIGYNPDFAMKIRADVVITGKLTEILPLISKEPRQTRRELTRGEIVREAIHVSGFLVTIIAALIGVFPVAASISAITVLYAVSEVERMERTSVPVIAPVTYYAATQQELYEFATAPIFFALGIVLTLLSFPLSICGAAIAAFTFGDSTASLFGKRYGKTILPFNKAKTLEGSVCGFVFALLAAACFVQPIFALLAAATAMIVESLPLPLDDNLVTPLVTGLILIAVHA